MTDAQARVTETAPAKVRVRVEPAPGSRLETLLTEMSLAGEKYQAAKERYDTLREQVEGEVQSLRAPDKQPDGYDIPAHPLGMYPAVSLTYTPESWILDGKALKASDPATWVKWAKKKKPYWTLKAKD